MSKKIIIVSICLAVTAARAADVPISALPAATSVTGSDVVPIVQSGTTKKASFTVQKSLWDSYYQPVDGDLTAISALTGTHTIYYRSAASTWSPVTIGSNLDFTGATLSATGLAASDAHFLTNQAESGLSNEVNLGALSTGVLKGTVSAGVSTISALSDTAVGRGFLTLSDPSAITFPRINADNTVDALNASDFRTAIGDAIFKTIAVSGQSDVIADAPDDTLTISAGSNITLTTNASTDTVTITAAGAAPSSAYDFISADNADTQINDTNYVTVLSKSLSGISANDTIIVDIWGTLLNNSGGTRTYSHQLNFGSVAIFDYTETGTTGAASATNRAVYSLQFTISVSASNAWRAIQSQVQRETAVAVNTPSGTYNAMQVWNSGNDNLTGTQTITYKIKSTANTATQTFTLHSYAIRRIAKNPP